MRGQRAHFPVRVAATFCLALLLSTAATQAQSQRTVAAVLNSANLAVSAERARAVGEIRVIQQERKARAVARAAALGLPVAVNLPGGGRREVADVDENGRILYRETSNLNAAISAGANLIRQTLPYSLDGTGIKVGVWDGGSVRNTHQEFNTTRVVNRNAAGFNDHATHVAGTIGASGLSPSARGMAPVVAIDSYDWNDDLAEMLAAGATSTSDTAKIPVSNHSYGLTFNDIATDTTYMGRYTTEAAQNDNTAFNTPFYLTFWAAGNDQTRLTAKSGFQSITFESLGKNTITVGAVNDAVTNGQRDASKGTMSSFSSWGPADDGRIKPDVVANGVGVYSTLALSDTAYESWNGTSMATPSAAGSAALLVELYKREFSGQFMRNSLLKGLLIHTADDIGNAGPDYKFGWGLINVKTAADLILAHKSLSAVHPRFFENSVTASTKTRTHTFQWDGVSPIRATLCWTDPAGVAQADNSRTAVLRHNLDLKITAPDGTTVHQPYVMPFVGTWTDASMNSVATTGKNNVDNVEQVYIASPSQAGTYTVTVSLDGNLVAGQTQQIYSLLVSGASSGTAPTTSNIADQSVTLGGSVGPVDFTVGDAETPASSLALSATSSNPTVVPASNIAFGGSGANRTVTVTPASGATGTATVTVTVSDGILAASDSFVVTVAGVPDIAVEELRGSDSSSSATYNDNVFVGRNGGQGMGAWSGSATGAGGNYVGATSVRARSFAVYAGTGLAGDSARATRALGPALAVGESFEVQLGYTGVATGGEIGVNFFSGGSFRLGLKFVGGSSEWVLNDGGSDFGTGIGWAGGLPSGGTPMQVFFRRNAGNGYSIILLSGSSSYSGVGYTATSGMMSIDSVQFYSIAQGGGEHLGFDGLTRGLDATAGSPFDFTSVPVGSSGSGRTFVLRNEGSAPLSSVAVGKSGANAGDFVLGGTVPSSLAAGASTSFTVAFAPTGAGERFATISVSSNDPDEGGVGFGVQGTATKAAASVTLGDLSQFFNGTPRAVSVVTSPPGLTVDVTYDGSSIPPTAVGSYAVVATINEANYAGSATGTLVIAAGDPTFSQWIAGFEGIADATAAADPDGDGVANAMEYFMGLDPTADDAAGAVAQHVFGDYVLFDYRRSKSLNGIAGTVKWSAEPDAGGSWSSDSVTDVSLFDEGAFEWRRASLPWTVDQGTIFLRMHLTID